MVRKITLNNPLIHEDYDIFFFSMCSCDYTLRKFKDRKEAVNHEFRCWLSEEQ
jgi:hypothetical protein